MPCIEISTSPGVLGIACIRGGRRRRCFHCGQLGASLLCDGPVAVNKTCNRPLCTACRVSGGPDVDYCRDCARDWPGRKA